MVCKFCGTEMERTFSFEKGKGYSSMECPNCGKHTSKKEITYTDEGNVVLAANKDGVPYLMYGNEGNIVKPKKKRKNKNNKHNKAVNQVGVKRATGSCVE